MLFETEFRATPIFNVRKMRQNTAEVPKMLPGDRAATPRISFVLKRLWQNCLVDGFVGNPL
jgi:hypothetical protein